ncbi:glycosyl hydrolase family 79 C-terminal domain-containing protein [Granulicella cerasi]|uniref:Glycosyl hydrolase family 79 C-terminal domain-containing protein n=1 Tax=Granulicella cerasi TaxID=741063 RepID=A0ABW1ZFS0_9BACT
MQSILNLGYGITMDAPVFSGSSAGSSPIGTTANTQDFITSEASHLGLFDLHYYGGNACNGNTEAADFLMTEAAINKSTMISRPNNIGTLLSTLHTAGRNNARIGEMNSIACLGQAGVSDTFQSALWFLDEAMSYAQAGVSGINLFSVATTSYYSPFTFGHSGTTPSFTYSLGKINPIYYGMLAESMMLQSNAALLPVTLSTSKNIKAYATKDSANNVRLLLINKEETASGDGSVTLTMSGGGNASLWKLLVTGNNYAASDYTALTTGGDTITLGGQTFKGSTDGSIQGTQSLPTVVPSGSNYTIPLPHTSAVIVKIPLS